MMNEPDSRISASLPGGAIFRANGWLFLLVTKGGGVSVHRCRLKLPSLHQRNTTPSRRVTT